MEYEYARMTDLGRDVNIELDQPNREGKSKIKEKPDSQCVE